jgi:hypothetical protein
MTDPEDPSRLLDSPGEPSGLRDALRSAQGDVGSDQQVARIAKRIAPLLGIAGVTGAAASSTTTAAATGGAVKAAGVAGGVKVGAVALALIVAGGGAWLASTNRSAPPPAPTKTSVAAATQLAPAASPAAPVVANQPPSVEAPAEAAPAPVTAEPTKLPDKPTPPAAPSEAELLEQARAALKSDPARALAKANETASRYPRGVLVQEREVIAIQALRKLGRSDDADRRAAAFSKAFPGSAFQRKLSASP